MRTLSRRREEYVGEWLPEPLLTSPDVRRGCRARGERLDRDVDRAGNTRAHGAGRVRAPPGFRYAARGDRPGRREVQAAVRQIALRAREHVAARRARLQVSPSEQQAVVERFLAALRTGHLQELMDV